ncbi:MAG: hypothetical protein BWK76_27885 [Desulfobulbaceae bacterium A2]|nr:MAG: hypothetical protein BWK76_27885 [Desulfobulbaceae bacterium A2]
MLTAAVEAALAAGAILRERYEKPHQVTMKGEIDLVTEADLASEAIILEILARRAPGIAVLAEESGRHPGSGERCWIIDPLDGTTNFAHGFPVFAVSIGLLFGKDPSVGVVYCPMQDELFCATRGGGTWCNGRRLSVTATTRLIEALVATGFPYEIRRHLDQVLDWARVLLPLVRDIRRAGAAAVDLAWVSCGRLDAFYEVALKPWDAAAGWLLVEEAGGRVSALDGRPFDPFVPELLASNGRLHGSLLELLA